MIDDLKIFLTLCAFVKKMIRNPAANFFFPNELENIENDKQLYE